MTIQVGQQSSTAIMNELNFKLKYKVLVIFTMAYSVQTQMSAMKNVIPKQKKQQPRNIVLLKVYLI